MPSPGGATVRIVFYVISSTGSSTRWFSAGDVLRELNTLRRIPKHSVKIIALLKKKINYGQTMPIVFGKESKMRGWLKKHHNGIPRFWFDWNGNSFRFKRGDINTLQKLIK